MDIEVLKKEIKGDEGIKLKPYRDKFGFLTIGIGRCLDTKGITAEEAYFMLDNDLQEAIRDLTLFIFLQEFNNFPEPVQHVFIHMRMNLGPVRFRRFKKMIAAAKRYDYKNVAVEMADSIWHRERQVGDRSQRLIERVEKCVNY